MANDFFSDERLLKLGDRIEAGVKQLYSYEKDSIEWTVQRKKVLTYLYDYESIVYHGSDNLDSVALVKTFNDCIDYRDPSVDEPFLNYFSKSFARKQRQMKGAERSSSMHHGIKFSKSMADKLRVIYCEVEVRMGISGASSGSTACDDSSLEYLSDEELAYAYGEDEGAFNDGARDREYFESSEYDSDYYADDSAYSEDEAPGSSLRCGDEASCGRDDSDGAAEDLRIFNERRTRLKRLSRNRPHDNEFNKMFIETAVDSLGCTIDDCIFYLNSTASLDFSVSTDEPGGTTLGDMIADAEMPGEDQRILSMHQLMDYLDVVDRLLLDYDQEAASKISSCLIFNFYSYLRDNEMPDKVRIYYVLSRHSFWDSDFFKLCAKKPICSLGDIAKLYGVYQSSLSRTVKTFLRKVNAEMQEASI